MHWSLLFSCALFVCLPLSLNGFPLPEDLVTNSKPIGFNSALGPSAFKESVDLIPVSSTVIPVTNPFTHSKRTGNSRHFPFSYSSSYARKMRLYEKSSKPVAPVRLITKHSILKGIGDGHD